MKRMLFILALLGLLLAACSREAAVFASYAPSGRPYEQIEIQVTGREQFAETGTLPITVTFTARTGEVLTITMKRQGEALFFAQSFPESGVQENDNVSDAALRTVLLDTGITNAGQFKLATAKSTVDLILAFSDPTLEETIVPAQFEMLETNLSAEK